jgi:hypothetical protein
MFTLGGAVVLGNELDGVGPDARFQSRVLGGTTAVFGATVLGTAILFESPAERLTKLWHDPTFVHVQPSVSLGPTGAMFGLSGTF